ncbi:MAG: 16S rRNA (guanine(966)-N(2))-methyltransferase RsmD [Actinomycetota bacterium]|nr:16S rRNA (guanine(966)-N(2))-methyltransferase RsmD [Actinomycetota bacterium]
MTRIIAGSAGGRRLSTPAGEATRPTADRVREAVFSALESAVGSWSGIRFLDLFAGSGAVGLEAVSRGAAHATLVEQHRRAAGIARRNADALGLSGVDVVTARAESFVRRTTPTAGAECYHVVFADPPYILPGTAVTALLADLVEHGWLCEGAVVVVERSARDADLTWPEGLAGDRAKRYGETVVWYGHAIRPAPST